MAEKFVRQYDYKAVPSLKSFALSNAPVRLVQGPVGSGKSSGTCAIEILRRAQMQGKGPDGVRRTRWAVARRTYKELMDTTVKTFLAWLPPDKFGVFNKNEMTYTITAFKDMHIEVLFRAIDGPDDHEKWSSLELTGACINELRELSYQDFIIIANRTNRYPEKVGPTGKGVGPTWSGVWGDTNAPDEDSWIVKAFTGPEKKEGFEIFQQPPAILVDVDDDTGEYVWLGLNPEAENIPNLADNYYERLFSINTRDWITVHLLNQYGFNMDGKPVYPGYRDGMHFNPKMGPPISGLPVWVGWDFGRTPCMVLMQRNPLGYVDVFDELTSEGMGAEEFGPIAIAYLASNYPNVKRYEHRGDPSGAKTRSETDNKTAFSVLKALGINMRPGPESLEARLSPVRKGLKTLIGSRPLIQVGPKAKMVRKGFMGGYQYRRIQTSEGKFGDKPDKNQFSHAMDAMAYPLGEMLGELIFGAGQDWANTPPLPQRDPDFLLG